MEYMLKEHKIKENQIAKVIATIATSTTAYDSTSSSSSLIRRSTTDIIADMLRSVKDGYATKTKIMYKTFLPFEQVRKYLAKLLANELLDCDEKGRIFSITEKGRNFIKMHDEIAEYISKSPV